MLNMDNFLLSLDVMWKGMLGIFIVTAVAILIILLLNAVTKKKPKKTGDQ